MSKEMYDVKQKLDDAITQLCDLSWMFSKRPGIDFTRNRKLSFRKVITLLLSMEGGTLATELLRHFGCSPDTASSSALIQQRSKIDISAFTSLFDLFVQKTTGNKLYRGFRLLAADGSDIQVPTNPNNPDSYFPGSNGQTAYSLLHLDAMYDLLQHTYTDAILVGGRKADERGNLCDMVDRSCFKNALLIADRGFEGYNLMAHIQEKGWKYLIRVKDSACSGGISSGLTLPEQMSLMCSFLCP